MNNDKPLNYRQTLFVDYYTTDPDTQGNCEASMLKAGYKAGYARKWAGKYIRAIRGIKEAIDEKTQEIREKSIANRTQRQAFWTREMNNPDNKLTDRLRASELLGKSQADFIDRYKDETTDQPDYNLTPEQEAIYKEAAAKILRLKIKPVKAG